MSTVKDSKRARELWVAQQVASAMNANGCDYVAVPGPDPPDAVLLSRDLRWKPLELEVVTLPVEDFTAREDNSNVLRFRDALNQDLASRGFQVTVHLLDHARRHGIPEDIRKQITLITQELLDSTDINQSNEIDFCREYDRFPLMSEYVSTIRVVSFRSSKPIHVTTPYGAWIPRDAHWILAAIQKKRLQARPNLVIAIDGENLIDGEQIESFKMEKPLEMDFEQLWLVTNFHGVVKLH